MSLLDEIKQELMKDKRNKLLLDYITELIKTEVRSELDETLPVMQKQVLDDVTDNLIRGLK